MPRRGRCRLFMLLPLMIGADVVRWCDEQRPFQGVGDAVLFEVSVDLQDGAGGSFATSVQARPGQSLETTASDFARAWQLGDAESGALLERLRTEALGAGEVTQHTLNVVLGDYATFAAEPPKKKTSAVVLVTDNDDCARFGALSGHAASLGLASRAESLGEIIASALPSREALVTVSDGMAGVQAALVERERLSHCCFGDGGFGDGEDLVVTHGDTVVFSAARFEQWWLRSRLYDELELFIERATAERRHMRAWNVVGRPADEAYLPPVSSHKLEECDEECPRFVVVLIEQGDGDTSTFGTFADIAHSLAWSLRELGLESRVQRCLQLGTSSCAFEDESEQRIVLGAHNLQLYFRDADGLPVMLGDGADALLDLSESVVYNFEFVPSGDATLREGMRQLRLAYQGNGTGERVYTNSAGSFATPATLLIMQKAMALWDYSKANLVPLQDLGIVASHLAVGYTPAWEAAAHHKEELIEVLFYGTLTPHRERLLASLRSPPAALRVHHANACSNGVFGRELDDMLFDARIVLDLRAFGDHDEWKMPRLARLLANGRFVVSEGRCDDDNAQCAHFRGGMVFAASEDLKATLAYYLARPEERRKIANKGRGIFKARPQSELLREPLNQLIRERRRRRREEAAK